MLYGNCLFYFIHTVSQHCVINYGVCASAPKCDHDKEIKPNPDNKWTFFQCKLDQDNANGFKLHCIPCDDDREYDDKLGYCKLPSVNGELVADANQLTDGKTCSESGLFIDYDDDTRYYECVVESVAKGILKAIRYKCPIYHVFSMQDRKCVPLSILTKLNPVQPNKTG